jgi:hypothetical protein
VSPWVDDRWEPAVRSRLIVLEEPKAPGAPEGVCVWCGDPIELVDGAHHSSRKRRYHRGDDVEQGDVNCLLAYNRSRCWSARDAVIFIWRRDHDGLIVCVDCGTLCEDLTAWDENREARCRHVWWEADHEVPLWAGGAHEIENFRPRCEACHREKTRREAAERAAGRRGSTEVDADQLELGGMMAA